MVRLSKRFLFSLLCAFLVLSNFINIKAITKQEINDQNLRVVNNPFFSTNDKHMGFNYNQDDGSMVYYDNDGNLLMEDFTFADRYFEVDPNSGKITNGLPKNYNNVILEGIDISEHNGLINLEPYQKGFVIIRIGYYDKLDRQAVRNMDLAEALGIPYGVYLYSYATNTSEASMEADFVIDAIKGRDIKLGVWYDMEDVDGYKRNRNALDPYLISNMCKTFCDKVSMAGYHVGIYASYSWFGNQIYGVDNYDKWVAHWGINQGNINVDLSGFASIHQFASVPLDRDVIYADLNSFSVLDQYKNGELLLSNAVGKVKVNVEGLRIRATASTNGKVLGSAVNGRTYDVYGVSEADGYTWYRIGENEWIANNGDWGSYEANTQEKIVEEPINEKPSEEVKVDVAIGTVKVTASQLRIRTNATTSSNQVGTAKEDTIYPVYETKEADGYTWYRIGENEWIANNGSWGTYNENKNIKTEEKKVEEVKEEPKKEETKKEETPKVVDNSIGSFKVSALGLRIRQGASTNSKMVGYTIYGTTYNVYEVKSNQGYTWYRIGNNKWIANNGNWGVYTAKKVATIKPIETKQVETKKTETTKVVEPNKEAEKKVEVKNEVLGKVKVNVNALRIRSGASTRFTNLGYATENKVYDVYEIKVSEGYTWYRIGDNKWIANNGSWCDYNENKVTESKPVEVKPVETKKEEVTTKTSTLGEVKINVYGLRIRSNHSVNSSVVGACTEDNTYDVYEVNSADGYVWYRIGENKWIANNGNWCEFKPSTTLGSVKVAVDYLRIRNAGSINGHEVGMCNNQDVFDVYDIKVDEYYTWYKIGDNKWIANNGYYCIYTPKP